MVWLTHVVIHTIVSRFNTITYSIIPIRIPA
nr:MAG TPA: hypothetical protein [Caudoviricetes sp.]